MGPIPLKAQKHISDVATKDPNGRFVMNKFLMVTAGALLLFSSAYAFNGEPIFEELHREDECPTLSALNRTTQYWHAYLIEHLDETSTAQEDLSIISSSIDLEEIRILEDPQDQAICTSINSHFWGLHTDVSQDRELNRVVPAYYQVYYQSGSYYIAFSLPYSAGVSDSDVIGGPSGGFLNLTVFDNKLNIVARISL